MTLIRDGSGLEAFQPAAALAARLFLAWIFVLEGAEKIVNYQAVGGYMEAHGLNAHLLPLVIFTELAGGVMVAAGLFTRLAAAALAGFCVLTAMFFHASFSDANQAIHFNKDVAIAGGFLALVAFGPGRYSLETLREHRAGRTEQPRPGREEARNGSAGGA